MEIPNRAWIVFDTSIAYNMHSVRGKGGHVASLFVRDLQDLQVVRRGIPVGDFFNVDDEGMDKCFGGKIGAAMMRRVNAGDAGPVRLLLRVESTI